MMKMRKKLIDQKDVEKECRNCACGRVMPEDGKILCEKSGIRNPDSTCKKFRYDPLCRVPKRQPVLVEYSEEDFAL